MIQDPQKNFQHESVEKLINEWKSNKGIDIKNKIDQNIKTKLPKNIFFIVLDQLYNNSIKANATQITISNFKNGLLFQDNGSGIKKNIQASVFEEHFSTTKSYGLGLFLVKKILTNYRAFIELQNCESPTSFYIGNIQ